MDVQPPKVLKNPVEITEKLLLSAGPSNSYPRVLKALSQPVLGCLQKELFQLLPEISEGVRYLFQTKNPLTFALSSSGNGGIETVFCNLVESGEVILVACSGFWAERAAFIAGYYDVKVVKIYPKQGATIGFSYEELEEAIKKHRPKLLHIVQGESSIGLLQPLDGLGKICHQYDCLLSVDGVASVGSTWMFMDRWEIDVVFTGSQKALGVPPGLAPISFSARAQKIIYNRREPMSTFWHDVKTYSMHWNCLGEEFGFHHTLECNMLYGLRESLIILTEDGLENVIQRHYKAVQHLYKGLKQLDLKFFIPDESKRMSSITTVYVPEGIHCRDVMNYLMEKHNIEIGTGFGEMQGKIFRFGFMGHNARIEIVDHFLKCLGEALKYAKEKSLSVK